MKVELAVEKERANFECQTQPALGKLSPVVLNGNSGKLGSISIHTHTHFEK
jgi:hypothetical protein